MTSDDITVRTSIKNYAQQTNPFDLCKKFMLVYYHHFVQDACPLSVFKRCPLFGSLVYTTYISAKARCPLNRGVCYLESPL